MTNDPFPVCLTFDGDAEAGVIGRDAANAERPSRSPQAATGRPASSP